ncbi:MAG: hypothetical protein GWN85_20685, partial [Gemmatimonadetes bacterium]|nr:hypothetical protein [Gemmatimonadota bacterium]NIR35043.1 hypothetical protein [Actinomycetota bacterium]NIS29093.1 hypothetical protein [Actinomycetota bacterium]NIU64499.1 hypothetical protein [Actinomycetota bacterium]NIW26292.1 hypothetical protein [Actinomycetota bacterium]
MIDEALRTAVEDGSGEALLALARAVTADEELRGAQADHLSSWAQALSDLGYLDAGDLPDPDTEPDPQILRAAVQRFLAELPDEDGDPGQAGAPAGVPPVLEGGVPDDELLREPGEVELARLLRFV